MVQDEEYEFAPPAGSLRYAAIVDMNSNSTQAKVARAVGINKRVLELGPSTGATAEALQKRGCRVVAIEIDPEAAALAEQYCERVIVADIDTLDWDAALANDCFDVMIAADVLEHLKDPLSALRAVRRFLKPDGHIVVSLPNVAHISVRLALLSGSFPYSEFGLLDRTHLRFYTRESMEQLFEEAGFAIGRLDHQERDLVDSEVPYDPAKIPPGVLEAVSHDPTARIYQFIVIAYPLPRADLRRIQERFRELAYARAESERRVYGLEQELNALRTDYEAAQTRLHVLEETVTRQAEDMAVLNSQLAASPEREVQLRSMLLDAHDQLIRRDDELLNLRQALMNAQQTIHWMQTSRSWQWIERSWQLRQRLKTLLGQKK